MVTLNTTLVPWMIAEFGIDFSSWGHCKTATAMIFHVVMTEQLGGYNERSFLAMINRYRVQQSSVTKFALCKIGKFFFSCFKLTNNS